MNVSEHLLMLMLYAVTKPIHVIMEKDRGPFYHSDNFIY